MNDEALTNKMTDEEALTNKMTEEEDEVSDSSGENPVSDR